ncbi:MAG: phosphohistidine swiveling domain-containing protein [Candidatus Azotimanducaceae bacterium]|jgi:phosphohistidine swiveling domain-containing protein
MESVHTEHQVSITEWFALIGEEKESHEFREEDNAKDARLEMLYQEIGLKYLRPERFDAKDLVNPTEAFQNILDTRGDELCAIRLIPTKKGLPKIRNRGLSIRECYETWFLKQDINFDNYDAYVCPHTNDKKWSTVFVVKGRTIFGEIVKGAHSQLTHGDTVNEVFRFTYDTAEKLFTWEKHDDAAEIVIRETFQMIYVQDSEAQKSLAKSLQAVFSDDYLSGYFETMVDLDGSIIYIDYNRVLPRYIDAPVLIGSTSASTLAGSGAYAAVAQGVVRIVTDPTDVTFEEGDILVTENTDIRFVPLMKKAGAIVTDNGGILSHAAIVARELKKPCVIGTGSATKDLQEGEMVRVDGGRGTITKESE